MAVIGKIRKQSGLLIVLIGVSMVLFLLGDFVTGSGGIMNQQDLSIGVIAGEEIDQQEFETRVQSIIDERYGAEGASEEIRTAIRENIWLEMTNEKIVYVEYENLGISVSSTELLEEVKNTQPGSLLYQYFTDQNTGQIYEQFRDPQTGSLNSAEVLKYIQSLLNSENAKTWLPIEDAIKKDVARRKYTALISKGIYATTLEADRSSSERLTTYNATIAIKEYVSIPDEEITVTDEDLKAYYDAHNSEPEFQNEIEMRDLQAVTIAMTASDEDINEIKIDLEKVKELFAKDSNDTAFVAEYSDSPESSMISYFTDKELNLEIKDTISNAPIGTVVGPYTAGRSVMLSKLTAVKLSPDSVRARHILIKIEDGDSNKIAKAKLKLDSLMAVAKSKKNFEALATEYSEDLGSKPQGGDLEWFRRGQMVGPFEKACFEGKKGDMTIVETQFGVHLIYITDQTSYKKRYLLSSVDRLIEPSKATSDRIYKEASKISSDFNTLEKFKTLGEPYEIIPVSGLKLSEESVPALGSAREIVRWAFDASIGDVSEPFEMEDKFVVVALSSVKEEGTISFEAAAEMIKPEVIKEKKAEKFIAEFGTYTDANTAAKNANVQPLAVDNIHFADNALPAGLGFEPVLLGTIVSLKDNTVSKPIKGNRGVFVAQLQSTVASEKTSAEEEKQVLMNNYSTQTEQLSIEALKKVVGVKDNRAKFY